MTTYTTEFELLDLEPYRMPTNTLEEIDRLSTERRNLLKDLSATPLNPQMKARLSEIDTQLEELWNRRRMELRRTG
jgi:hypothetical protein